MDRFASRLESFRETLHLLARLQVADDLAGKVDLSGVVQQTMLDALQATGVDPAGEGELLPWLRRVLARNLIDAIRHVRRRGATAVHEYSLEQALEESSARVEAWLAREDSSPESKLARDEQLGRLAAALGRLPEDQRRAVELHHLMGLPLVKVGEQLGRSREAASGLLFRGMTKLRAYLQDPLSDDRHD